MTNECVDRDDMYNLLSHPEDYFLQGGGEFELISQLGFLRAYAKYQGMKFVIYGAGDRGKVLQWWMHIEGVDIEFFIDTDAKLAGKKIGGVKVFSPADIQKLEDADKYMIVISPMAYDREVDRKEILFNIFSAGFKNTYYPFGEWTIPKYQWDNIRYYNNHVKELCRVFDKLADEESKQVYYNFLKAIITNSHYQGKQGKSRDKYWECYLPKENEIMLNVGSYVGDTIFNFIENRQEIFEKIYAVEANEALYELLKKNMDIFPLNIKNRISCHHVFLNKETARDLHIDKVTLINMDIEGAEKDAINGLRESIRRDRPVLAICAYHLASDLVELPDLVHSIAEDYQIYFRKYASSHLDLLGTGELVMYAVPPERVL